MFPRVPVRTVARVVFDVIDAGGSVPARAGVTFVDACLTVATRVTEKLGVNKKEVTDLMK